MADRAQKILGVSLLTLDVQFHRDLKDGLEKAAREAGYKLQLSNAEYRVKEQAAQLVRFVAGKEVDAILVTPCDPGLVGIAIEQANRSGIPVFTVDVASTGSRGKVVAHIASDNVAGGRKAGELMVRALGGQGKVAITLQAGLNSMADRVRGFKEVLARTPGLQLAGELPIWTDPRKESNALLRELLGKTAVNGVFCGNDELAMGALAALEATGKLGQVRIVGYDGTEEARAEIRKGRIYGDVVQDAAAMAALAVRTVRDHLAGKPVPAFVPAETSVFTG